MCAQPILESGVIELVCSLTQSDSPALRVNGTWALMVRNVLHLTQAPIENLTLLFIVQLCNF